MRKPLLTIIGLLAFLGIAVVVHRLTPLPPPPPPPPAPPQKQSSEAPLFSDPILPAEDITTRGFQSGGLGLSRSAWEVLHGKPQRVGEWFLYQGQTYAVSYRQDMVWQLKCTWKRPGLEIDQVRTRSRRYLPLDSRHQHTLAATAETVVEQYFSQTLAQLLAQTAKIGPQPQPSLEQQGTYTVTHTLEKERVIKTLVQIGSGVAPPTTPSSPG